MGLVELGTAQSIVGDGDPKERKQRLAMKVLAPTFSVQASSSPGFVSVSVIDARVGFKNAAHFSENHISADRLEFKIRQILKFKFENFENKKSKKYVKKLDQIIRTSVEKFFQISTISLDKIQIESKI
jgi:hypothetical protein